MLISFLAPPPAAPSTGSSIFMYHLSITQSSVSTASRHQAGSQGERVTFAM